MCEVSLDLPAPRDYLVLQDFPVQQVRQARKELPDSQELQEILDRLDLVVLRALSDFRGGLDRKEIRVELGSLVVQELLVSQDSRDGVVIGVFRALPVHEAARVILVLMVQLAGLEVPGLPDLEDRGDSQESREPRDLPDRLDLPDNEVCVLYLSLFICFRLSDTGRGFQVDRSTECVH